MQSLPTAQSGSPPAALFEYLLWGNRVLSDFDLGEVELFRDAVSVSVNVPGTIRVAQAAEQDWTKAESRVLEYCLEDGTIWQESWNAGGCFVSRFPGLCSFRISPAEMRIECAPQPEVNAPTVVHLILDHAIPRLLSMKPGHIVLHASAVQVDGEVMAILGHSGQGKSTLAGWFASRGFSILTDDCLLLRRDESKQQWLAYPSYQSVRLWPDSVNALGIDEASLREFAHYSSKKRTGKETNFRFAPGGAPLRACFVLDAGDEGAAEHSGPPEIQPIPVGQIFVALMLAVFRLDAEDEEINRREFEILTNLADTVKFWSLRYERRYDWLPEVEKIMIDALRSSSREHEKGKLR